MTLEQKRKAIEPENKKIPVYRQCELLELSRSSLYYKSCRVTAYNEQLMRILDEQYLKTPFYGVEKMTECLRHSGHQVNSKRVRRLLRNMGLEAIYPQHKQNLSKGDKSHKIYPYLLKDMNIDRINQVWSSDITYIRMYHGWLYLTAVMDWYSRYVLSWELSLTLETDFCVKALEKALRYGRPEIFNTDQGSQYTSSEFTGILHDNKIRISMDGRGRAFDNIFIERLWRSVKVEEVYLKDYQTVAEASLGLGKYFAFYNQERLHESLEYGTPAEKYFGAVAPPVALRAPSGLTAPKIETITSKKLDFFV